MTSQTLNGIIFAALAFASASPLHAAPSTPAAAASDSVTYHIERHDQQVTVEDTDGKKLTTFSSAAPTLQGLFAWSAAGPTASTPRLLTLTLKDQNGRRLWSTPVSITYPQTVSVNYNSAAGGTLLTISTTQNNAPNPDPDYPPASGLIFTIGQDGRPISSAMLLTNTNMFILLTVFRLLGRMEKTLEQADYEAHSFAISSPAGASLHMNQDGTGTMQLNGINTPFVKVTKDSKVYVSFPWNGHKVLIEQSCAWNITSDGDLMVNAPVIDKATAIK